MPIGFTALVKLRTKLIKTMFIKNEILKLKCFIENLYIKGLIGTPARDKNLTMQNYIINLRNACTILLFSDTKKSK